MHIVDLSKVNTTEVVQQLAAIVTQAFPGADGYPTLEIAQAEVMESLAEGRISLVALDEHGKVAGWIGAIEAYNGNCYELHPLVVRRDLRGQGIGRMLVETLEERVKGLGAMTIYLGTDDVDNGTNIAGKDVYPDPLSHAQSLESTNNHPLAFYRKIGRASCRERV